MYCEVAQTALRLRYMLAISSLVMVKCLPQCGRPRKFHNGFEGWKTSFSCVLAPM